ncbi:hypothetical protein C8J57DRAFT_1230484 [Mycena rebaudengoi]|nr:hypothetical protein C8J57DRAFT_1230484 [Mycena rebaudengoi]
MSHLTPAPFLHADTFESPSLCAPGPLSLHSGLSTDPNPWVTSPSSIPWEHNTPFSDPWSCNAVGDVDAPWRRITCVDALANRDGLDAVSEAFLVLIEAYKCGSDPEVVALLRLLLCNSRLPREVLLGVVDLSRLLEYAAISSSRVFHGAASREPSSTRGRDANLEHPLNGADHSAELLSLADTTPHIAISDHELEGSQPLSPFSNISASPVCHSDALNIIDLPSNVPTSPSTISAAFLMPPLMHPFDASGVKHPPKMTPDRSLDVDPEDQHSASGTHFPAALRRRCMDCEVEHTTQWRTHPQFPGYLCNACGQHHTKHKSRRSPLAIRRERARAHDKYAATVPLQPNGPPERRGGEVIMRVFPGQAEHT